MCAFTVCTGKSYPEHIHSCIQTRPTTCNFTQY